MSWVAWFTAPLAAAGFSVGAVVGAAPSHADDAGFMNYLNAHGYTARYAGDEPITEPSVRALGLIFCLKVRVGRSVEVQQSHFPAWPQFALIAEAAQHELCPGA
jgi:hypothetical protein